MKNTLAAIDVGAHSVRMLIVEADERDDSYEAIEELEIPVPLGSDVFKTGKISNHSVELLCSVMKKFRAKLDEYKITEYRAIATSAVREAVNADVCLERILHCSGIRLKIFTGADEARLGYLIVKNNIPTSFGFEKQKVMLADIGTGACQVSAYENGVIRFTETVRIGTLRLVENLSDTSAPSARIEYLAPMIASAFGEMEYLSERLDCDWLILTGASVRAVFDMAGGKGGAKAVASLKREQFEKIMQKAASMTVEEIVKKCGIKSDLAEAVLPCCLMIDKLMRLTGAGKIVAPAISTKYALVEDYIAEHVSKRDFFEPQILGMSMQTALRYGCDPQRTRRTAEFAETLFAQTQSLHGLAPRDLLLLKVAAMLHKTGLFISNQAYHKHSFYVISNTDIAGLSAEERKTVALIARYHRKSLPKPQHSEYMSLPAERRFAVNKLAGILRLACGLADAYPDGARLKLRFERGLVCVGENARARGADTSAIDTSLFQYAFATKIIFS